ncbi:MAG: F0F1 ATP synthase subunit A [Oscillospiraceae bacterium]|nr:F0F1 ATP synthase subunit A [Oscillospiraceae bacterium]
MLMTKQERKKATLFFAVLAAIFMIAAIITGKNTAAKEETIQQVMRDAVLHDMNKVSLFGIMDVNPGLIAGIIVSCILIIFALICRIFVIPKFTIVPGKLQTVLETAVGLFDNMAKGNSKINGFLGAYIFAAGAYIFTGTLFELLGVQVMTTEGLSISLPAPLSDINGAIMMGCLSYLVIMSGGIAGNGIKGIGKTLKEYSLPISLSFRLFGALLSGALVTELVYYYKSLSYVLPVLVGVLFTLLHALIQAYVLTMLTSLFYGQVSDNTPKPPKEKKLKQPKEPLKPHKKRTTVVRKHRAA